MTSQAITLDGSTQYGTVDNFSLIDAMTDGTGTIEGWFWNDPASVNYSIAITFDKADDSSATALQTENAVGSSGVNFKYDYGAGTDADGFAASGVFTTSTWVHVAQVFKSGEGTRIYVNGTEISYGARTTPIGTPTSWDTMPLNIGYSQRPAANPSWTGRIGGFIRLWNYNRSAEELRVNRNVWMNAVREAGLIINLNFQEGSGTTIGNDAFPSNPCNLTGSPTWTTGPTSLTPKKYGILNINGGVVTRPAAFAPGITR